MSPLARRWRMAMMCLVFVCAAVVASLLINVAATSAAGGDGQIDTSFNAVGGVGANNSVSAIALQSDGKIIIGGSFTAYNGDFTVSDNVTRLLSAPTNTAPVASASPNPAVTNEDTPVQITLQGTDADDNNLTFTITQQPTHGTLSAVSTPDCAPVNTCTATVTYTPAANYNGADSFKFKANDGTVDSNVVTVNITVNAVADLSISDVAKAEGNSGTTTFTFTISLDSPAPAGGVTFNASTADNMATVANNDYVGFANQAHSIPAGSTSTTVDVTVNGDTVQESNKTFYVNVSNVTNATVADGQGQGTILNDDGAPSAGQIIISEFRLSGPGAAPTPSSTDQARDEFVELYNATDSDFVVADSSPVSVSSNGWAIVSSDDPVTPKYIIPAGTRIPARGHYLAANLLGYTLSLYPSGNNGTSETVATADGSYSTDIPDGSGLALFRTTNPALFATPTARLDAIGFTGSAFFEGTPLQPAGGITTRVEHSFVRKQTTGRPLDTDNNQSDFMLVSTSGGTINGVAAQLGAPGPENLTSPINRGAQLKSTLLDPAVPSSVAPNRVRDTTSGGAGTPTASGTLDIRRTFTNKTGADVTRLRFRIVDVTAGSGLAGTADVRAHLDHTLERRDHRPQRRVPVERLHGARHDARTAARADARRRLELDALGGIHRARHAARARSVHQRALHARRGAAGQLPLLRHRRSVACRVALRGTTRNGERPR